MGVTRILQIHKPRVNRLYKLRGTKLLYPEGIVELNHTAAKILSLCDGERRIQDIKNVIFEEYGGFDMAINIDLNESFLEFYGKKWIHE